MAPVRKRFTISLCRSHDVNKYRFPPVLMCRFEIKLAKDEAFTQLLCSETISE